MIHREIFAERNWHDFAARGRAVRTERFKYIKNFDYELTQPPPADAVRSPTFQAMRKLRDAGALAPAFRYNFEQPRAPRSSTTLPPTRRNEPTWRATRATGRSSTP